MTATPIEARWPALRRAARTVVVVDVVESVRLIEQDEEGTVRRWQSFVGEVVSTLLPEHGGRLVKSLGDGLMVEFDAVPSAIRCALAMQTAIAPLNDGQPSDRWLRLRAGIHAADVIVDAHDIYGSGVNLAARLASLAGPDQVVVSAGVRDSLTDGLDVRIEDLGDCFLKHLALPVRAYRIGAVGETQSPQRTPIQCTDLRPAIAVIPFRVVSDQQAHQAVGELLAEEIIAGLSKTDALNVISRLSTQFFKDRESPLLEIGTHLHADYALSGSARLSGTRLKVSAELAQVRSGRVVWADSVTGDVRDLWLPDDDFIDAMVRPISRAIIQAEVERAKSGSLPTLEASTLMLGAITLMHRTARSEFDRALELLEHLVARHGQHAKPQAWLANWYALRITQGLSPNAQTDTQHALDHARRALDADPESSLALAIDGLLHVNLMKDLDTARDRLDLAVRANPNESLAWLFKGVVHGFSGEGLDAEGASERALVLSPLDPLRHYYDSLAATAALGALNYDRAIVLAQRSLRVNRMHPSTYRALAIAQASAGQLTAARETVQQLLLVTPGYTVRDFRARSGFSAGPLCERFAQALEEAGLPK
ncbi:adenylate/guanylate cyclase domain-containing protein [Piscinibacter sp. XHJ-5]|uniref:adenylate/guanylate cyclase domain-containing protein n=1 Tax=Piscinibacter sp. XHJ-5 TaxID=3037797 RepID=UPI00245354EC|nr:adenylate/guanylate cyclase domain-containing protein [Piscinibacter sp. XHJ-5]